MHRFLSVVLVGSLLFGGPLTAMGQDGTQIGGTLGFNLATMQSSEADPGFRPSYAAGVVLRQKVIGSLSLQSELLLSQKGAAIDSDAGASIRYGAAYLDLPVLVHITGPTIQRVGLHGEVGGFGAVKVFEQQRPGGGGLNLPLQTGTSFFKRFDAGPVMGLGATFSFGDRRFNLTARYAWGMMDVARSLQEQPIPTAPFPEEAQTRTWSLLVRLGL